jgi:acyl-CoA synthetase (NDP forming)
VNKEVLDGLFRPKSVAVIGASGTPGKIGYSVVEALINGKYEGKIYPINLKLTEILGRKAYPTIGMFRKKLILLLSPFRLNLFWERLKNAVKRCKRGHIITSGFSEMATMRRKMPSLRQPVVLGCEFFGSEYYRSFPIRIKLNASFAPMFANCREMLH